MINDRLMRALHHAVGLDLASLLLEPDVTDMYRNVDGAIRIKRAGAGTSLTGIILPESSAISILNLAASSCGRVIGPASPFINAMLPTGGRVAGTIRPLTDGVTLSIRKASSVIFSLDDFIGPDTAPPAAAEPFDVRSAINFSVTNRDNIVVSGGTGAGKTTLLKALMNRPDVLRDRQVTIENEAELVSGAADLVQMIAIKGVFSICDGVHLALRLNPNRLIVGEAIEPADAEAMITAMNTGHDGSFSTLHANSADDAIVRLQNMCRGMHPDSILTAVQCFVHMKETTDKRRIIEEVVWPARERRWRAPLQENAKHAQQP